MKKLALAVLALAPLILAPLAASAQTVIPGTQTQSNTVFYQANQVGTTYTNSTTTASNVTNLSVTVPASIIDAGAQYLEVCYGAQTAKATAGTGTLSVLVNGVAQAPAARTVTALAAAPVSACHYMARPTSAAFTVTVQGVSSDTNQFSVTQGQLTVRAFFVPSL